MAKIHKESIPAIIIIFYTKLAKFTSYYVKNMYFCIPTPSTLDPRPSTLDPRP